MWGAHCRRADARDTVPSDGTTPSQNPTGQPTGGDGRRRTASLRRRCRDLKVEVKARKWLTDVAVVCPATKPVVARQYTHVNPEVCAKAGEVVKRNKCKGAVQGFVVEE
jgi:hypothetical protein